MLIGVDVGGTFTDAALLAGSTLHTAKVLSTPEDQSRGVLDAVDRVLARAGAEAADVESFAHGMTVGTNALLTETGAPTALITTAGFTDLLEVGRQNRPSLYRLCAAKPPPLVPPSRRFGARERVGPEGVIEPLADDEVERLVAAVAGSDAESVAVCLLFSHLEPAHERAIAERLRAELDVHVSASHEVLAQFREYERCSTTAIDAYLSPLLGRYLGRLAKAASAGGLPEPDVMLSSGGVAPAGEAARAGAWSVLSGPAGGAVGAGILARLSADGNALGFDLGGTSCDVCVIEGGRVRRTDSRELGGRVIQLPMVDVHTVGAGGGSIAWRDAGGALRVGPRSAGAEPGPACYGRGGSEPTVTDANLALGYLAPGASLAGDVELDLEAAHAALARLGESLGLGLEATAAGIVRVANAEMVRALRVVTVERGIDPRDFALLPFGGAGPMHAAALAEELGIDRLLCPRASGVLSALGLLASERRRETARTVMLSGDALSAERVAAEVERLRAPLAEGLAGATVEASYELRYAGQAFELAVPGPPSPQPDELAEGFAAEHERRYGYRDPDAEIELVTIRVALLSGGREPELDAPAAARPRESRRRAWFRDRWVEASVIRGEPAGGARLRGPSVLELPETTLVLPPGWDAEVDGHGTVIATRDGGGGEA